MKRLFLLCAIIHLYGCNQKTDISNTAKMKFPHPSKPLNQAQ